MICNQVGGGPADSAVRMFEKPHLFLIVVLIVTDIFLIVAGFLDNSKLRLCGDICPYGVQSYSGSKCVCFPLGQGARNRRHESLI